MSDANSAKEAVTEAAKHHKWLVGDALVVLTVATLSLGYSDFGDDMQKLTRGLVVFSLWVYLLSSLQIQLAIRSINDRGKWVTAHLWGQFILFFVKFGLLAALTYWACCQGMFGA